MTAKISDYKVERYLLLESSDSERKEIELLMSVDDDFRQKIDLMRKENISFSRRPFKVSKKADALPFFDSRRFFSYASYAISLCLFFSISAWWWSANNDLSDTYRLKGEISQLRVYHLRNGDILQLNPESKVRAGALLQLSYQVSDDSYGMIFSIDGRGQLTVIYPESGKTLAHFAKGKEQFLPSAMELDDAPDAEVFFLAVFNRDKKIEDIIAQIRGTTDSQKLKRGELSLADLRELKVFSLKK